MAFIPRNDEQIKVGTTVGLIAGANSFKFDGSTVGLLDYRGYEIVPTEIAGRGMLVRGLDYSWDYNAAIFNLLQVGDIFRNAQYYNIHFENPFTFALPPAPTALIDWTYFIRDIMIPNIDPAIKSNSAELDRLNKFILKYETQCLKSILGYPLYKAVVNEQSQRITDLLYGTEYTDCQNNLKKWDGIVRPQEFISLIANYIYFYYQESLKAHTSGVGTMITKPDGGREFSPADKMAKAWNFFSEQVYEMTNFLWFQAVNNVRTYPEFTNQQFFETRRISRKIDSVFSF